MRILQTHVDYIEYEPVRKEIESAETTEMKKVKIEDALVLFTSVEKGDNASTGIKAMDEVKEFMDKVKCSNILLYPFAHLSRELCKPKEALEVLNAMEKRAKELGIKVSRAPFGWNKAMEIKIKGHPLAEQLRVFGPMQEAEVESKAIKEEEKVISSWYILEPSGKLTPAKNFDYSKHANLKKFVDYEVSKSRAVHQMPPHITIMKRLELVDNEPGSDPGNMKFMPKGRLIKSLIEQWVTQKVSDYGGMEVETPVMYDYEHPALKEYLNRFPARQYIVQSAKKDFFLRFSACFGQFLLMANSNISYKDLPMRIYELTRYSFRLEKAGELAGLRRLRAFTMPDMHTLCSDIEMAKKEFMNQFKLCVECMKELELENYEMAMRFTENFWSTDKKFVVGLAKMLKRPILIEMWNTRFAYFDPKFEFNFVDSLGKAAALSTVQLDHENGRRFNIKYIDKDNSAKHPYILHMSPSGAVERVIYALLEDAYMRSDGKAAASIPTWLSPTQVRFIPLSDRFLKHVNTTASKFEEAGIRVDIDDRKDGVGKKVRYAELEWVPYIIVIGDKELKSNKVALRDRKTGKVKSMSISTLIKTIKKETAGKPFKKLNLPIRLSKRPGFGSSGN
jgi:threonyl-tRNA synthetase